MSATPLLLPLLLLLSVNGTSSFSPFNTTNTLRKFPALLIFGDSTVDTGNNNFYVPVLSISRADHPPYGKDFPGQEPTGRFSNGKLVPDFLASSLGIKEKVPPFLDPTLSDKEIKTGVSFASGGSGYDDHTNAVSGGIPMLKQLKYFRKYIERLQGIVGLKKAKEIIKNALVIVSAGSNDLIISFHDSPVRSSQFNVSQYQDVVLRSFQNFVEELLKFGCKTVIAVGIPPLGCTPLQITERFEISRTCSNLENSEAQSYNRKLEKLLPQLQASVHQSRFIYFNIYDPLLEMISSPEKYGKIPCLSINADL
ncbi:hypothetical protein Ancab_007211 [Ancistrocladus abbreviatus]